MTQTTYTDNVMVDGSQDIQQLRVQGHGTQNQPLQTWENNAAGVQAQVTSDGRVEVGDFNLTTPNALLEVHRAEGSLAKPKRGLHLLGQVNDLLSTPVQWLMGELELKGSTAISALHTALRIRASNLNTGTPAAGAELRGGDIEVINEATPGTAPLPKVTGLQVGVTNKLNKTITDAIGLKVKLNNAGTISNPYAIYAEGPGIAHFEDYVDLKSRMVAAPPGPNTGLLRLYPNAVDGKLYGIYENRPAVQVGGSGSGGLALLATHGPIASPTAQIDIISIPQNYTHLKIMMLARNDQSGYVHNAVLRPNNDVTAANYLNEYLVARAATLTPGEIIQYPPPTNGMFLIWAQTGTSSPANSFAASEITLFNYSVTGKTRNLAGMLSNYMGDPTNGKMAVAAYSAVWTDTANAITSLTFAPQGGQFAAGTTIRIYGVA